MQRWSVRGRFLAGLTLVVVLGASDRLGGLGRTAPLARQTGRPLTLTAVAHDLSAIAPKPRRVRWGDTEASYAVTAASLELVPPADVVRSLDGPPGHVARPAGHRTSSPRAPPAAR